MPLEPERRQALMGVKLAALVRDHWGEGDRRPSPFPGGAALTEGSIGWVLVEDRPARGLGGALAWARRAGAEDVHVLVESAAGTLARRATMFAQPPQVWEVNGRSVSRADIAPLPEEPANTDLGLAESIRSVGVEPIV